MKVLTGLLVLIILFFTSCGKEQSLLPDVYVDISFSYDGELADVRSPGGVAIPPRGKNAGLAGLIFYNNNGTIMAFDRCSTVNPEKKCAVTYEQGSLDVVIDPCSGAAFFLSNGAPAKAPAERALKRYNVILQGNNIRVVN